MTLPRWMHKLYAHFMGYFWLPCSICGENVGGHEWRHADAVIWISPTDGKGICNSPDCLAEARRRNEANGFLRAIERIYDKGKIAHHREPAKYLPVVVTHSHITEVKCLVMALRRLIAMKQQYAGGPCR